MAEERSSKPLRTIGVGTLHLPIMGVKVKVRRPSVFSLVASGGLPGELTSIIWKIFGGKENSLGSILQEGKQVTDFSRLVEKFFPHVLVDVKVTGESNCFVDPDGYLNGTINALDIPDVDKNHLFLYGVGITRGLDEQERIAEEVVAADLETFRGEPTRPDAGSGSDEVQPATVEPSGDQPGVAPSA